MDKVFAWAQGSKAPTCVSHDCDDEGAGSYRIKIIPTLSDNYSYLVIDTATNDGVIVDASEALVVHAVASRLGVRLVGVLTTHYHADHSGGNAELATLVPSLEIVAGELEADRVPGVTKRVADGETFTIAGLAGLEFKALHTPGHTKGHVAYYLDAKDGQAPAVFTGDVLFVGGCGRFMEGTPEVMQGSLQKLADLDPSTRVFSGHEYAKSNLTFSCCLEPENVTLKNKLKEVTHNEETSTPSAPSTIKEELQINPFLRVDDPSVQKGAGTEGMGGLKTLAAIRRKKDTHTPIGKVITMYLDTKSYFS